MFGLSRAMSEQISCKHVVRQARIRGFFSSQHLNMSLGIYYLIGVQDDIG